MSEELQLAFSLLLIGMTTVFLILTLVVGGGKVLINIINRFYKDEPGPSAPEKDEVPVAIISAVVQHITAGEGVITDIRKID